jgi:hypothetical protein
VSGRSGATTPGTGKQFTKTRDECASGPTSASLLVSSSAHTHTRVRAHNSLVALKARLGSPKRCSRGESAWLGLRSQD